MILEKGIRDGKIEATSSNLRTLAQAWSDAKEMDKAIPALERAARVADDGDLYAELANILLDREEWEAAESAAQKALNKGKLDRPDLPHVARGMALFNMKRSPSSATPHAGKPVSLSRCSVSRCRDPGKGYSRRQDRSDVQ